MKVDFEKTQYGKGIVHGVFDRKRLRKIFMLKGKDVTFAIITRILNPDTLEYTTVKSF